MKIVGLENRAHAHAIAAFVQKRGAVLVDFIVAGRSSLRTHLLVGRRGGRGAAGARVAAPLTAIMRPDGPRKDRQVALGGAVPQDPEHSHGGGARRSRADERV
jgi:hypothetical protein